MTNLDLVRTALRITTTDFDAQIQLLINACVDEMQHLNIRVVGGAANQSPQIQMAIVAYCKWRFGNNEDKDEWRQIYDRQISQLKTMTDFTNWRGGCDGSV